MKPLYYSCTILVVVELLIGIGAWASGVFPIDIDFVVAKCGNSKDCSDFDSIEIASQLGRLDFVSGLLAVTALLVSIFSLFQFFHYREVAKSEAKDATENYLRENVSDIVSSLIDKDSSDNYSDKIAEAYNED